MLDPVSALGAPLADAIPSIASAQQPAADFSGWLVQQMDDLNTKLSQADMQVRHLAVGDDTNVHQVMMSLEKARLSLELVVQVRNKVLEAYQSVMQMQV